MRSWSLAVAASFAIACGSVSSGTASGGPDSGISGSGGSGADAGTVGAGPGNPDAGNSSGSDAGSVGSDSDAGSAGSGSSDAGGGSGGGSQGPSDGGTATGAAQLTTGENAVTLAIDATNIYWASINTYTGSYGDQYRLVDIRFMPKSGGTPAMLAHTSSVGVRNIVASAEGVIWAATGCALPCDYPGAGREWGLFTADAAKDRGYRQIAQLTGNAPAVAADATAAYAINFNWSTGRWNLIACDRNGTDNCKNLMTDAPLVRPVYFDSGKLYFLDEPTSDDYGPHSDLDSLEVDSGKWGFLMLQSVTQIDGLRVDGNVFGVRAKGSVWTGSVDKSRPLAEIWKAPNGGDVDISQGRVYWNQNRTDQYPGCLGSANLDGTDGKCLDEGDHGYAGVRVDDSAIYFIRDGQIVRLTK